MKKNYENRMCQAYVNATRSPDPSTQNGSLLFPGVGHPAFAHGWNHIPKYKPQNYHDREYKYANIIHAEVAAIQEAGRLGIPTQGATLICPWAACMPCAEAILNAGVTTLVVHELRQTLDQTGQRAQETRRTHNEWLINEAMQLLVDNGVDIQVIDGPLTGCPSILVGGEL